MRLPLVQSRTTPNYRRRTHVAAWIVAIALSTLFDAWVTEKVSQLGIDARLKGDLRWLASLLKNPGEIWCPLLLLAVATLQGKLRPNWRAGAFVLAAAVLSGLNAPIKWLIGRPRPYRVVGFDGHADLQPFNFSPMFNGLEGLFGVRNLAFPSGHTTLAFAMASSVTILYPRWRPLLYSAAILTAVERVAENAHWTSDTAAGAFLGICISRVLSSIFYAPHRARLSTAKIFATLASKKCVRVRERPLVSAKGT